MKKGWYGPMQSGIEKRRYKRDFMAKQTINKGEKLHEQ